MKETFQVKKALKKGSKTNRQSVNNDSEESECSRFVKEKKQDLRRSIRRKNLKEKLSKTRKKLMSQSTSSTKSKNSSNNNQSS